MWVDGWVGVCVSSVYSCVGGWVGVCVSLCIRVWVGGWVGVCVSLCIRVDVGDDMNPQFVVHFTA